LPAGAPRPVQVTVAPPPDPNRGSAWVAVPVRTDRRPLVFPARDAPIWLRRQARSAG